MGGLPEPSVGLVRAAWWLAKKSRDLLLGDDDAGALAGAIHAAAIVTAREIAPSVAADDETTEEGITEMLLSRFETATEALDPDEHWPIAEFHARAVAHVADAFVGLDERQPGAGSSPLRRAGISLDHRQVAFRFVANLADEVFWTEQPNVHKLGVPLLPPGGAPPVRRISLERPLIDRRENVPVRRGEIAGRVDELDRLREAYDSGGGSQALSAAAQALSGLGGVGKTRIAREHAHRLEIDGAAALIWWIRAESRQTVIGDLLALGEALRLAPSETADATALAVVRHLEDEVDVPWLIIFDNAAGPATIRGLVPVGGGQAVITSRTQGPAWDGLASELPIGTLDGATSIELIRAILPGEDEGAMGELAARLAGHALALTVVAHFVKARGTRLAAYLARPDGPVPELSRAPKDVADYERAMSHILEDSRAAAEADGPGAGEVLDLIAFLDHSGIRESLITKRDELPGLEAALLDVAVPGLRRFSLIDLEDGVISVHPLTQELTRARINDDSNALARAIECVAARMPGDAHQHERWSTVEDLAAHTVALARLAGDDDAWTPSLAVLFHGYGTYLHAIGGLNLSRHYLERALRISQKLLGDEHPDTLTSMGNLASTLKAQGDLARAREQMEQVLEIHRRILGDEDPDMLISMANLAQALYAQGDLAGARERQEQVLEIRQRVLGDEHPDTLISMNNLAGTLYAQGDLARACEQMEQVLEIRQRVLGDEHPDTLTSMNNLAETLKAQGDLAGARERHEQVLEIRRRVLGDEHPGTLTSMNNLAGTLYAQGDLARACEQIEQVLEIRRRVLGDEHPDTLTSMNDLAVTLHAQGDLAAARELVDVALSASVRKLGAEHPTTRALGEFRAQIGAA